MHGEIITEIREDKPICHVYIFSKSASILCDFLKRKLIILHVFLPYTITLTLCSA
jgi:hypothetical protein